MADCCSREPVCQEQKANSSCMLTSPSQVAAHSQAMKIPSTVVEAPILGRIVETHAQEAVFVVDPSQPFHKLRVM